MAIDRDDLETCLAVLAREERVAKRLDHQGWTAAHLAPRDLKTAEVISGQWRCRLPRDYENAGWRWRKTLRLQQRPQRLRPRLWPVLVFRWPAYQS